MSIGHESGEQALLGRAQGGDESAFGDLIAPYRAELHAHSYRILGSVHDAEDALQEALLRAWRGLPRFEGRSSVRPWLHTIVSNAALDLTRRRARQSFRPDSAPRDAGPAPDEPASLGEPPGWSPTRTARSATSRPPRRKHGTSSARASSWRSSSRCNTCRRRSGLCSSSGMWWACPPGRWLASCG